MLAPDGEPIPGMRGRTERAALAELFPGLDLWVYARAQGYSVRWFRTESEKSPAPAATRPVAGRIEVGRGSVWGAGLE